MYAHPCTHRCDRPPGAGVFVSCLTWVLGTALWFSVRAESTLNCRAVFLVSRLGILRSCWVRVVLKSSRTCSNKARDGEKGHSRKEGCMKSGARAGVAVTEPRVLATQ